ncbi:hypothetical protein [Streptomyces sp. NPDC060027]|uniref:hypothetical protein n=1 Tax=Streptomyces sp. NPDC060027 TaxID=3347040 RepID=UPI0036B626FC
MSEAPNVTAAASVMIFFMKMIASSTSDNQQAPIGQIVRLSKDCFSSEFQLPAMQTRSSAKRGRVRTIAGCERRTGPRASAETACFGEAALLELITASTILPAITYGSTVVLYLAVRGGLDRRKGAFDLGRFELPVAICALVWTLVARFVLVAPRDALVFVVIVVGLLVAGGLFFLFMLKFDRAALETEPGDVGAFKY